jgi:hypothetical protein
VRSHALLTFTVARVRCATLTRVARIFAALLLVALPAVADWSLFKSGPLEVYSNGSDDAARQVLATFEQARWLLAKWLGRPEVTPLWPVRITVVKSGRDTAQYRTPHLVLVRDGYVAGLTDKDAVPADWLRDFTRILLRDDTRSIPQSFEVALASLVSTLEVKSTLLTVGKPPAVAERTRDWARLHLFCVDPNYAGRVRVLFSNLQQAAPLDTAYRNAFQRPQKEMEAEVESYFRAAQFAPQTLSGKPLNPERDYRARVVSEERGRVALADVRGRREAYLPILNTGGKSAEALEGAQQFAEAVATKSESAVAWLKAAEETKDVAKARELLLKAMDLNKRWTAPHLRLAALEEDWGRKAAIYNRAIELDPRDTAIWISLAEAQQEAKDFAGAALSWRNAERSTNTEPERLKIEGMRRAYEQRRLDLEAAERKRVADEKQKELDRLRDEALANIRAAEQRANAGKDQAAGDRKVVDWWDGPKAAGTVEGTLERVDCLRGQLKLHVKAAGKVTQLTVPKPDQIAIIGSGEQTLGCGVQKPPRAVKVEHNEKNEVLTVEFK